MGQFWEFLLGNERFRRNLTAYRTIPPQTPHWADFPADLDPRLPRALAELGIRRLYSHQAEACREAMRGRDVVVVTPTASGKTLCYNLPVLDAVLKNPQTRSLYLFPTKALSQDQLDELHGLIDRLREPIRTFTYDGDTPASARPTIRKAAQIVVTNPDMLHVAILPHHTKWLRLFQNLRYVVIDELHQYRGVFGSHVACVIRRLNRLCEFYGSRPTYICCSATIANPEEMAQLLLGRPVHLVDRSGAPRGEKHFFFYNPPVVNRELGIRRSALLESKEIAARLVEAGAQTIVFSRSRLNVEVLSTYLKHRFPPGPGQREVVRGYRGGYLPRERREIERDLREGRIKAVVSTNALELGIDIGTLNAAVLCGYPGTIASTWQQAGRAGRGQGASVAVLVASSSPLDQFIITHPDYFFARSPEHALLNPDNPYILASHLKCAAFELPFRVGESFGGRDPSEYLEELAKHQVLHRSGDRYYWATEGFPAEEVSLRSATWENFVVVDISDQPRVIGEVDRFSAPLLLHEEAIYLHEGQQYQVEKLDYPEKKAYVRRVRVNYYTDAQLAVDVQVLDVLGDRASQSYRSHWGEVLVRARPTMFKKIKFYTHENLGTGPINLPEEQMHTTAYWLCLTAAPARVSREALQGGLAGVAQLLANVAPLYLMCDPGDLRVFPQVRSPFTELPTIYLYDRYPGGTGLAERAFELEQQLLEAAAELLEGCSCASGCPSCVGAPQEVGVEAKEAARAILSMLVGEPR